MSKNVLLVFSGQDAALSDGLRSSLERRGKSRGDNVLIVECRNQKSAFALLAEMRIDFVVVGLILPPDLDSPPDEAGGLTLCESLRATGSKVPIALIAPQVGNILTSKCVSLGNVNPYYPGPDLSSIVGDQVEQYSPPSKTLDLVLNVEKGDLWDYQLVGTHFDFWANGKLKVEPTFLRLASSLSELIGRSPADWYVPFQDLGKTLIQHLCRADDFSRNLREGIKAAGPIDRTRITLTIDEAHYPIAFEAMFPPEPFPEVPWMVIAPLHRNVRYAGHAQCAAPLFSQESRSPLKILIICADVDGYVNEVAAADGTALKLQALRRVQRECDLLRTQVERHATELTITRIQQLPERAKDALGKRAILEVLGSETWDIVHFAGHSFSSNADRRAYLFVGGKGAPEPIEISEIASYLARTKLVYLSSCQSGSSAFAVNLAQRGVPTVIGFRWSVDDRFAELHAHLFYHHLFRRRHINTAFLNTRKAIYKRFERRDRVWASSMLVMGGQR